jgi:FKBP-type peptidyl-prolyl cis-trans isomerase FkpA
MVIGMFMGTLPLSWRGCIAITFCAVFLFSGCGPKWEDTGYGMRYVFHHRSKEAKLAKLNDWLLMDYTVCKKNGDTITTTAKASPLEQQLLAPPFPGALETILAKVGEGDSLEIETNVGLFYPNQKLPKNLAVNDTLSIYIKIRSIASPQEKSAAIQKQVAQHLKIDDDSIRACLNTRKILDQAKKHSSGLYYLIHIEGKGEPANVGDSIAFYYHGSLLNGEAFDIQDKTPVGFILGQKRMLPGWEIAFDEILTEGSQVSIYLPSHLAFGYKGKDLIPPFTPLKFQIGLKAIVRAKK